MSIPKLSWHLGESKTRDPRITPQRSGHTATLIGKSVYVVGGYEEDLTQDLHAYLVLNATSHTWKALQISDDFEVASFSDHAATLVDDKVFLIGGYDEVELFVLPTSVVRIFDPVTEEVTCVHAHGVTPTARYRHVMEFFERKREIVMFGGKVADDSFLDELHALNVDRMTWVRLRAKGRGPPPQSSHMSALCGNHMFILLQEAQDQELYVLTYEQVLPVWSRLGRQGSVPPCVYGGSMNYIDSKLFVFGGVSSGEYQKDLYIYDVKQQCWKIDEAAERPALGTDTFRVAGTQPGILMRHKGVYLAGRLLIVGGFDCECSRICELRIG